MLTNTGFQKKKERKKEIRFNFIRSNFAIIYTSLIVLLKIVVDVPLSIICNDRLIDSLSSRKMLLIIKDPYKDLSLKTHFKVVLERM